MKITVISDTHGVLNDRLRLLLTKSDRVIHAGDIGSLRTFRELKSLNKYTYAVRGNCDRAHWAKSLPETLEFHLDGLLFYVIHSQSDLAFRPDHPDIIICGHTHRYQNFRYGDAILLNPGSCSRPRDDAPSCAVLTTENGRPPVIRRFLL